MAHSNNHPTNTIISSPFLNLETIDSLLAASYSPTTSRAASQLAEITSGGAETAKSEKDVIETRIQLLSAKIHLLVNDLNLAFPPRPISTSKSGSSRPQPRVDCSPSSEQHRASQSESLLLASAAQAAGAIADTGAVEQGRKDRNEPKADEQEDGYQCRLEEIENIERERRQVQVRKDKAVVEICKVRLELAKAYMTTTTTTASFRVPVRVPGLVSVPSSSKPTASTSGLRASTASQTQTALLVSGPAAAYARGSTPSRPPDYTSAEVELSLAEKDCRFIIKRNDRDRKIEPISRDLRHQDRHHQGSSVSDDQCRTPSERDIKTKDDDGTRSKEQEGEIASDGNAAWVEDVRQLRIEILHQLVEVEEGLGRPGRAERWRKAISLSAEAGGS
ncbi:hypothetical protein IAU59_003587 [Kwoniella sp. CBS 9459]